MVPRQICIWNGQKFNFHVQSSKWTCFQTFFKTRECAAACWVCAALRTMWRCVFPATKASVCMWWCKGRCMCMRPRWRSRWPWARATLPSWRGAATTRSAWAPAWRACGQRRSRRSLRLPKRATAAPWWAVPTSFGTRPCTRFFLSYRPGRCCGPTPGPGWARWPWLPA